MLFSLFVVGVVCGFLLFICLFVSLSYVEWRKCYFGKSKFGARAFRRHAWGSGNSHALPASPLLLCLSKHSRTTSTFYHCHKSPGNLGHFPCDADQLAEAEATGHTFQNETIRP